MPVSGGKTVTLATCPALMELEAKEGQHTVNLINTMNSENDKWSEEGKPVIGWGLTGAGWSEGG